MVPTSPASILPATPVPFADVMLVTVGAIASMVTTTLPLDTDTLPARSVVTALSVCAPPARVEVAIDQLPPEATPLPTGVLPSYRVTVAPASAVPVNVGVTALVTLSPLTPPSLATARTGVVGALGLTRSTVNVTLADVKVLPALSVVVTRRL